MPINRFHHCSLMKSMNNDVHSSGGVVRMLNLMVSSNFKNNEVNFPLEHGIHCSHPIISSMNNDVIDLLAFSIISSSILIKTTLKYLTN